MDKLNIHQDVQDYLKKFTLFTEKCNKIQKGTQLLENVMDKLRNQVEKLQKSELNLTQQLETISGASTTQTSVNMLYVALKEKYNDFQSKHDQLLTENALLQEKHLMEKAELQNNFTLEKNQLIEELTKQINILEVSNQKEKDEFLKTEAELYNELQLTQASNALQVDDFETRLLNLQSQLRASNQSCNSLHEEYLSFQIRSNNDLEIANKRIDELKEILQHTERQLRITQEQLFNATKSRTFDVENSYTQSVELNTLLA